MRNLRGRVAKLESTEGRPATVRIIETAFDGTITTRQGGEEIQLTEEEAAAMEADTRFHTIRFEIVNEKVPKGDPRTWHQINDPIRKILHFRARSTNMVDTP